MVRQAILRFTILVSLVQNIGGNTTLGESYHGYWSQDIYKLNEAFGSEADLKDLISQAKTKGMGIMVDVVSLPL
jgi:alpha-amylase